MGGNAALSRVVTNTRARDAFGAFVCLGALRVKTAAMIRVKGDSRVKRVDVGKLFSQATRQINHGFGVFDVAREMVAQFIHKQQVARSCLFKRNDGVTKHPVTQHIAVA